MIQQVIFFGGFGARQEHIDKWVESARMQQPTYEFYGIPYPSRGASDDDYIRDGAKIIEREVQLVDVHTDPVILVGHSSGCAGANEVARKTRNKNIRLVVLDGFVPTKNLQQVIQTDCWYASNHEKKITSRNATAMKFFGRHPHEHICTRANNAWALHFSLVNNNVPPDLGHNEFIAHGYDNCEAFLDYLTVFTEGNK